MMSCTGRPADECLDAYLEGTLPENEARRFEEHYFECPVCLGRLEALEAVARKLGTEPKPPLKAPIPWPTRVRVLSAIAAMLVLGFFTWRATHQPAQPTAAAATPAAPMQPKPAAPASSPTPAVLAVSRLADFTLPAFRASSLRGGGEDAAFDAGMKAYSAHDCATAEKNLALVAATDESHLAARFYQGACQMKDSNLPAATKTLRSVADAGDSPQQEAALYYLAQVALAGNDATTARHFLARTISLHGDFEGRARAQLSQIR